MSTSIDTRKVYRQVADSIIASIESGDNTRGANLPSERDLAALFKVSRPTIREAMIALEIRSVIEARQGSGHCASHSASISTRPSRLNTPISALTSPSIDPKMAR